MGQKLLVLFPYLLILLFIGIFFVFPLARNSFYLSHDGEAQIARFGAYIKAFSDGQFPLRWAGDLNYKYGSPVLIFYYPLPGIMSIALNAVGINLENIFKFLIGSFFILSFITFFLWARTLVEDNYSALVGSLLYGLAPYHFLNLYVRGDVAELIALSVVPLVLLMIEKSESGKYKFAIMGGIFYALLILSHNSVSLVFSPIFLAYSLFRVKSRKSLFLCFLLLIIGLALSSFFWIPAVFEAKYTGVKFFIGDMYKNHFPSIQTLFYSLWGFGPDVNKSGGLSPQLGVLPFIIPFLSVYLIFKRKKFRALTIFWFAFFLILLFLVLKESTVFWNIVPFLKQLQFPWRLIGIASFASAVLGTMLLATGGKRLKIVVSIFIIIYSFQFLRINYIHGKSDRFYLNYPGTTYYHGQASSIWTAGDFYEYPKNKIEIIGGQGKVIKQKIKSNVHELVVNADSELSLLDNTVYFPGWNVKVDGKQVPIEFQDMNHRGLIEFKAPAGFHSIDIIFGESRVRFISDVISLATVVILTIFILTRKSMNFLKP